MSRFLFIVGLIFLVDLFLVEPTKQGAVIYYVKPSQSSNPAPCPTGDLIVCETLQHYLDYMHKMLNEQENVTMIFLEGNHTAHGGQAADTPPITTPVIKMIGKHRNINVQVDHLTFANNNEMYIENITLGLQSFNMTNTSRMHISSATLGCQTHANIICSMQFNNVTATLMNATLLLFESSGFFILFSSFHFNGCSVEGSYVYFLNSEAVLENHQYMHAPKGAITSYASNITLAGIVMFRNNTGVRGGAMNLFVSTLKIAPGTKASFVNNAVSDLGGALYIEPSFTEDPVEIFSHSSQRKPCFYQLLDCSNSSSYSLYFANNSATNGGDDIYGASLLISCPRSQNICKLNVTLDSTSLSSVSSSSNRICLCDSNGNPECEKLQINGRYYPGEQFNISAVLVGGDYGTTIGTVHTNFMAADINNFGATSQTPLQLKSDAEYSQIISSRIKCSKLTFSLYANHTLPNTMMYLTAQYLDPNIALGYYIVHFDHELPVRYLHSECEFCEYVTPVFINVTVALPCPPGFTLIGDPPGCDCFPALTKSGV